MKTTQRRKRGSEGNLALTQALSEATGQTAGQFSSPFLSTKFPKKRAPKGALFLCLKSRSETDQARAAASDEAAFAT